MEEEQESLRAFLAFEVSPEVRESLMKAEEELKQTRADIKLVERENLHFTVKFLGNVPATGATGGTLRHRGWRASSVSLPPLNPKQDNTVIAPAEIEVE